SVLSPRLTPEAPPTKGAKGVKGAEKTVDKVAEKAAEKAPAKAPEKAVEKTAAPKAAAGSFFIQVMALADADKAKDTQKRMADAGVRAYTEVVTAANGKVTRVRAGPFASREEAQKVQEKLQGMGLEGKVAAF
ncbi:MAG: SPOR domain-containing protein, partial [Betaproteobacteria bacterium]|nr:SPOR domain-containing protein [Betaproteobacteria bacterium]